MMQWRLLIFLRFSRSLIDSLSLSLSVCQSIYISLSLFHSVSFSLSLYLSICLPVCLSLFLTHNLFIPSPSAGPVWKWLQAGLTQGQYDKESNISPSLFFLLVSRCSLQLFMRYILSLCVMIKIVIFDINFNSHPCSSEYSFSYFIFM